MKDKERFEQMDEIENELRAKGYKLIAGIDEVGRGPLAGPLVVAGVVLDKPIYGLRDSKKLSKKKIAELNEIILENCYNYRIEEVSVEQIDFKGIRVAVIDAMNKVATDLKADYYLIDYEKIELDNSLSITKGDDRCNAIAAASIIAKYYRDKIMENLDDVYPEYGFDTNVGYGTKKHTQALNMYGYIDGVHRKSFNPVKKMIKEEHENN